ncbi:MAG: glycosyltransferase [Desulfurococcaceae archaeon]
MRTFEVLKYLNEFENTPILYIPYSDLINTVILEKVYKLERFTKVLKELERFNVKIPIDLYENFENISLNVQNYLDSFQKKGMRAVLSNFRKSINEFKNNIFFAKDFLRKCMQSNEINPSKLEFVYSMHERWDFVVTGAFLAKSLKKRLYVQLQLEPFKPLREFVIDDWISRVTFGGQKIFREIARLLLLISQPTFLISRYSYSYALGNNLDGLLAVSEAPLITSGLKSWVNEKGIKLKIVRPGNAVDEEISKKYVNEKERRSLLQKKEDIAVYWARLHSSKGLFDILPVARKLATEGYRLVIIGRFDNISEKRIFFKICEEQKLKNIEYLGWLPRKDLFDIVSRSKVLIYPSHSDAFPLVVLEALFLGCSVVAYDIPAIRSVYNGLKPVRIVREYDCKAMAEEAIRILKRDISEHEEEHLDHDFMNFLKLHSSWKNVAKADLDAIKEMMNH